MDPYNDPITMNPGNPNGDETLLGILQRLRDISAQPMVPDNPLAQLGTIFQGFQSGTQGQANPALKMFADQRQQAIQGLSQQATIQGSMLSHQAQQSAQKMQYDKMLLDFNQGLLASPSPEGRMLGAQGVLDFGARTFGITPPTGLAERLAQKLLTPDEEKRVMGDLLSGIDPKTIQAHVPNFNPVSDLPYYTQLINNDAALKARGFETQADLAEKARKRLEAANQSKLSALGLGGTTSLSEDARNYIQLNFKNAMGTPLMPWDATPDQARLAITSAQARRDEHVKTNEQFARERISLAKQALDLAGGRASILGYKTIIQPLQKQATALESVAMLDNLVDQLPGLPPAGSNVGKVQLDQWKRQWANPTDPNLVTFKQLWGPIMVGQVDRSMFDEKGIRAMQAFQQQFDLLNHVPSREALHKLFATVRELTQSNMQRVGKQASQMQLTPDIQSLVGQVTGALGTTPTAAELEKDY